MTDLERFAEIVDAILADVNSDEEEEN